MISIRKASIEDCELIHSMAWVVFPHTYGEILPEGQVEYMMEWMYSLPNLHKQMTQGHIYFIASIDGEAAGYASIEQEEEHIFHLQKIYVLPQFQGRGLGGKLFEAASGYIKSNYPAPWHLRLNVNRYNKALGFYQHLGMYKESEGDFHIGNGYYMNDYIMAVDL